MNDNSPVIEHKPVLLDEVIDSLALITNGKYVDGTFGRGGHSQAILASLGDRGRLLALDRDPEAIAVGLELHQQDPRFEIVQARFAQMSDVLGNRDWAGKVNGILLDLGVSSPQLDKAERGFSFLRDGPLDMRMDPGSGISAADWIATVKFEEMTDVFKRYGEERYAKRIARAIVREREQQAFTTTKRLADVIAEAHPNWQRGINPATRCFQAIRIFVNGELDELRELLNQTLDLLAIGGRLAVISFHSLEDRMVKRFMRDQARGDAFPPDIPVTADQMAPRMRLIGKQRRAGDQECVLNPRARSAVLRVAERLA